ncbi:hypothetical protein OAQ98_04160 [Alphaproteobacteria bacterium]|nr:hypothetical protein [Alphaproteobacteria bacterium]
MIRILIIGGTRYLGKAIANQITKKKFEIATLSRSEEKTEGKHFVCDRKNSCELKKVFINFSPNIILDMVNFDKGDSQSISELYEQGFISELNHYIMISSFFVYNHFDYNLFAEKRLSENLNLNDIEGYTKRKIQSELRLYTSNLMDITTILRLPFVFSADDYSNRFQRLCELCLIGSELIVEPSFKYSLVRKDDAAEAIIKVLNSNSMGITDLSNVGHITSKKLVDTVKGSVALIKDNGNREIGSFPYFVEKDICLNSQKITIDLPILEALRIEAENYWLSR